jgi:hypothetical protein
LNQNKNEGFQSTTTGYQADIEAIRNLSSIATQLTTNNNLTMPGILNITNSLSANDNISVTNKTVEGGRIRILNSLKDGKKDQTNDWSIWNMTGGYGNKLSFWRYNGDGTNAGSLMDLNDNGTVKINGKLATNNLDPNNMPDGWSGGIRTYDLYSSATIACGPDGKQIKSYLNSSGDGYFAGNLNVGSLKIGNTVINEDHLKILTTAKFPGNLSVVGDIVFDGDNKWIIHTPDDGRKSLMIAPMGNGGWNWEKQFKLN